MRLTKLAQGLLYSAKPKKRFHPMTGRFHPMTKILETADDVTPEVLKHVDDCLDWFEGSPLSTEDFIDKFSDTYLYPEWEILDYSNPAANKVMREARKQRKERE